MFARPARVLLSFAFLLLAGCQTAATDCSTNPVGCICQGDSNCGGANPRCDTHSGRCAPCLPTNDNCTGGLKCVNENGEYKCAMGCITSADCPAVGSRQPQCCASACVDTQSNLSHCGGCNVGCGDLSNATASCVGGSCLLAACDPGYADCDRKPMNGCETPTGTDSRNCGGCGTVCAPAPNSTPSCANGQCQASCIEGFSDCDNNSANGCEVDSASDAKNCGNCGFVCGVLPNAGTVVCLAGKCAASSCKGWFGDCDRDPGNGCEADTQMDARNCGACGQACPVAPNGMAGCAFGQCVVSSCGAGFGDCDRNPANGCEKAIISDANNCGACGRICVGQNSKQACDKGACVVAECNQGFTDCDKDAKSGCEANLQSDIKNCNACGMACVIPPNADGACKLGICGLGACKAGYADCNMGINDGCEANLNDVQTCGSCNNVCQVFANASTQCLGGKCTIGMCNQGFDNCDNNINNGCERNLQSDPAHCGRCGVVCNYRNAAGACNAGKCQMGACNANFADCNKMDNDGCELDVGADPKNCGACANVCPQNAPNCVSGKCSDSIHNTVKWENFNGFGAWGCHYFYNGIPIDQFEWIELGYFSHDWKSCMLEASKRSAMAYNPSNGDWDQPGWFGHRNGGDAMIGEWWGYSPYPIGDRMTCVLMREPLSQGKNNSVSLKDSIVYDGNKWSYEDYGTIQYWECQMKAGLAGGSIITPYTLGLGKGDDYWVGMTDICASTCWSSNGGNDMSCEQAFDPDPGSRHKCMIGFMNN